MDANEPRGNGERQTFEPIPFVEPMHAKKPKNPIFYLVIGFLLATVLIGGAMFVIVGFESSSSDHQTFYFEPDSAQEIAIIDLGNNNDYQIFRFVPVPNSANEILQGGMMFTTNTAFANNLTLVTPNDVNHLQFASEEINHMYINADHGNVTVGLHDEDFISVHSTQTATYTHYTICGTLKLSSAFGSFYILLPSNLEVAIDVLVIISPHSTITIGENESNMTIGSLHILSEFGTANLTNLVVPNTLVIITEFGTINVTNVLSDNDGTYIRTGDFGRIIAH